MKTPILLTCCAAILLTGCLGPIDDDLPLGDIEVPQTTVTVELPAQVESAHPYPNDQDREWVLSAPEFATSLILPFDELVTEWGYDYVLIYDGDDALVEVLTGDLSGTEYVVPGNTARIRLVTDGSVTRRGLTMTRFLFTRVLNDYTDHRPVCQEIGSYGEGWYWADSGEFIVSQRCGAMHEAACVAIGSRSEGWSSDGGLIIWDHDCHRTVRIALASEACGPSIGFACYDGLYCAGLPEEGVVGGSGTCLPLGACETAADCAAEGNVYPAPACVGHATCEQGQCAWHCDSIPVENKGWVTYLVRDLESAHPYDNDFAHTWTRTFAGAERFRLYFQRIDVEAGYDELTYNGLEETAALIDGTHEDTWTDELLGDTAFISLTTDGSVTGWGFAVTQVSIFTTVPEGQCADASHCEAGERCEPLRCFNPYAPCFGMCVPDQPEPRTDFAFDGPVTIPDADPAGISTSLTVTELPHCLLQVHVDVDVSHSYVGDLVVALTEPGGTQVVLHDRTGGWTDDLHIQSLAWPEDFTKEGDWTLTVSDNAAQDEGALDAWALHFSCRD